MVIQMHFLYLEFLMSCLIGPIYIFYSN